MFPSAVHVGWSQVHTCPPSLPTLFPGLQCTRYVCHVQCLSQQVWLPDSPMVTTATWLTFLPFLLSIHRFLSLLLYSCSFYPSLSLLFSSFMLPSLSLFPFSFLPFSPSLTPSPSPHLPPLLPPSLHTSSTGAVPLCIRGCPGQSSGESSMLM